MNKKLLKLTAIVCAVGMLVGCAASGAKGKEDTRPERNIDASKPLIALTFDDGPNLTTTPKVLDMLEKYEIVGSFFLIGSNMVPGTSDVVKRAYDMGCDIESHSLTHSYMNKMSAEEIHEEMDKTASMIEAIIGERPKFFRPPYLAVNNTMYDTIDETFIAGYGCDDYDPKVDVQTRIDKVIAGARDGAIVLLHDAQGNQKTVDALDVIIPKLKEAGYEFVTVSELFTIKAVAPEEYKMYSYVPK